MEVNNTSISLGLIISDLLTGDPAVASAATKIFPVAADNAQLPYVVYRCCGMESGATKDRGAPYADTVELEVCCCAGDYAGSVWLAEAVRGAIDRATARRGSLVMRSCTMTGREESYENDAYVQTLVFTLRS